MSLSHDMNEEKFGHLLKPIRELAANWDINIASELEEYLEVLESVTFAVEGSSNVNFAEGEAHLPVLFSAVKRPQHSTSACNAHWQTYPGCCRFCAAALLVQGSAHVYSKKVEYLHQLVYQALDVIHDRKWASAVLLGPWPCSC
jgi:condensin-2 complex subunit H2